MAKKPYYITTAIAYASGKPHIGNTYEIVLADSIARYKRFAGYDVRFQTGTDEHGQKIENKAFENMQTPKEFVDEISGEIKNIWDLMNTSYDKFIRTTDADHERQVQKIFKKLYDQGDIYKGEYVGKYCTPCESFFTDSQLVDGKCPDCGRPVQEAKEEAYFFKLSKYQDRLMKHIEQNPDFIQPESRKNEMINNFIKPGLQDLCVSRTSFKWGIPVDFDDKHIIYVWIDALSNYITGLGYDVDGNNDELYKKYWPADLHLIGKDILRFHTIYWPIMLMALGVPLPKQIFGHPWLIQNDGKMSKSKGNVMYADDMVRLFGVDAVRFFVLHEMPFENDGIISWELVVERINSELANTLGNLVNRTISMSNKYFGGVVTNTGVIEEVDEDLKNVVLNCRIKVAECMDKLKVADAISEIFTLFKRCNKYIDETMPWALAKDETKQDRLNTVLYNLVESIVIGASLLEPYMPDTSVKILNQLNAAKRKVTELGRFGLYPSGNKVTETPEILFARLDVKEVMAEVAKFAPPVEETIYEKAKKQKEEKENSEEKKKMKQAEAKVAALNNDPSVLNKQQITIEEFEKMQLMIGEIIACEEVQNSRKLLCSQVKFGENNVKQIVSGIKGSYSPEEMVGKRVVAIVNLKPCKLAGVVSEGMLLCAEDAEGNLSLLTTEKNLPGGSFIS
ncbi:methionine--tRNA ligase [Coprococcus eutactus]|uniref:Methionine--tRNA ligase n=1 Tax=Coprococcus ammoniilyticus TaxID=2981785 RepID=A0ABV1EIZ6_9FIRM|nr:methionine--tRNA ligase [Coprococcus ammoniilyticus]NSE53450.1 methionine--tRNA ligase [Coprococcus eutactus]RGH11690.1 methionine--tRNA ligase [Clostridium sp. AF15-31]RHV77816.1 methionine--tRNA ligase [Clostridium sp. OF10-22XD]CCY61851.1 methionine--tRNA ligase [Clostridium sp. CAG:264]SCG95496.1 Methionine--tRNA ligase [uncultured Coprococcus sp.]HAB87873.1 methionine--tRNA ligase [Coprococcus sp.]